MRVTTRRWFPLALVLIGATLLLSACAFRPLLSNVTVRPEVISPNADGADDVSLIKYSLARGADVSIYFEDQAGKRYYFRNKERRSPRRLQGLLGRRHERAGGRGRSRAARCSSRASVLPDGEYKWVIEAVDLSGRTDTAEGKIALTGADTALPEIHNFTVMPQDFTPNQDGLHDRVGISYYLMKAPNASTST